MSAWVRVRARVRDTEAEGPGRRWALWVQGCPLRCASCCNPEMLPERARDGADDLVRADDLAREAIATPGIEGVTLLGGEPFAQADALAELAEQVREAGLSVLVFSGFTLEELRARGHGASRLLAATDLLIDGPYDRSSPDRSRRWIGSANQRLHVLGARQPWIDPRWKASPSLEIRLARGVLTVNGWPPAAASVEAGR